MAQIDHVSTKSDPLWLYLTAATLSIIAIVSAGIEQLMPRPESLIQWRSITDGKLEAVKQHKPVLYEFSAEWCGPCKEMETIAFSRHEIADVINKQYIPVRVMDEQQEKGKNPPAIEKLQKQCSIESFPTLVVVPWYLVDAKSEDIYSTGSAAEEQLIEEMNGGWHSVPAHSGFRGLEDIRNYLFQCRIWHSLPLTRGKIHWKPLSEISHAGKRPRMLAFVENCGAASDSMRKELFQDDETTALINEHFTPILIDCRKEPLETNSAQIQALKNKFGIKSLPALVILSGDQKPSIQDGYTSEEHTRQFLTRELQSAK